MSAPWVTIALADIYAYRRAAAFDAAHTSRFQKAMENAVNMVRNKIKSWPGNQVSGTVLTVPPEAMETACLLIVEALTGGVPGIPVSDDDRTRFRDAHKDLERFATNEFRVSQPDDAITSDAQANKVFTVVTKTPRTVSAATLRGL